MSRFEDIMLSLTSGSRLAALAFVAVAVYLFCLRFLFPGYLQPLIPNHSDLYAPVGCLERSLAEVITYPRPLTYIFLRESGLAGVSGSILIFIIAGLAFVVLTAWLAQTWASGPSDRRQSLWMWPVALCFLLLVLGHPEFYFEHRHDPPGTLSGLFLLAAVASWRRWLLMTNRRVWLSASVGAAFLMGLAKECYYVSLAVLLVTIAVAEGQFRLRRILLPLVAEGTALAAAFAITATGFCRWAPPGGTDANYGISIQPSDVAHSLGFLAGHLLWPASAGAILVALALNWQERRRFVLACGFLCAGFAALLPYAVLPRHLFAQYAWAGAAFVFVPLLLVPRRAVSQAVVVALTAIAVWQAIPRYKDPALQWMIEQEKLNRGLLASFARLRALPPEDRNIVVTGVGTALNPWQSPDFLRHECGRRHWTVAIPADRKETTLPDVDQRYPRNIDLSRADLVVAYNARGEFLRTYDRAALAFAGTATDAILVPEFEARDAGDARTHLVREAETLLRWGWPERAEPLLEQVLVLAHGRDAYAFYFLGRCRAAEGDPDAARGYYERAIAADSTPANPAFRQALAALPPASSPGKVR